jgi:hypothetical protein
MSYEVNFNQVMNVLNNVLSHNVLSMGKFTIKPSEKKQSICFLCKWCFTVNGERETVHGNSPKNDDY